MKNQEIKTSNSEYEPKKTTKEKIFDASIDLFSQKGFDAVTVREIAKEAGIREGSIYNHYKNKEAILDAIIDHFKCQLAEGSLHEEETYTLMEDGPEVFFEAGTKMFMERINTTQIEKLWRLVTIETYHNEKIREFFNKELLEDPINSFEKVFSIMIEKKMIKPFNPRTLAYEYWSFTIYLIFEYFVLKYDENFDSCMDIALEKINNHVKFMLEAIKN